MRQMVLDVVNRALEAFPEERLLQQFLDAFAFAAISQSVEDEAEIGPPDGDIPDLAKEIRAAVLIDGDMIDVLQADAGRLQAITDSLRRKAGPVLDPAKALFLGSGDQHAVAHDRSGGIAMKGIETEDDQEAISALSRRVGGRVGTGNRVEKASQSSMQTFPQLCDRGDERGLLTMNSSTHAEEVAHFGQLKSKAARRPSRNCAQGHRAAHA